MANLHQVCEIMLDQIRTIENKKLVKKVGSLTSEFIAKCKEKIPIVLDLD